MMVINNRYEITQIVYLFTDEDQCPHIISSIKILPGGGLLYTLVCGHMESCHYEFEITGQKQTVIK